jgi:amino acid transporter
MPTNGGVVAWIEAAFPSKNSAGKVYFVSSTLSAVSYIVDSAIYPTMAAGYITRAFLHTHAAHNRFTQVAIAQAIIVAITITQVITPCHRHRLQPRRR